MGSRHILANFALVGSVVLLYLMDYSFFMVLIPRVIHDLTAFAFYITHDQNRNSERTHNALYSIFDRTGIPVAILCPLLAVIFAFPLTYCMQIPWVYHLAMIAALFHYYTDGITWKREAPHREFVLLK